MLQTALLSSAIMILALGQPLQVGAWWFADPPEKLSAIASFNMDGVQGSFKFSRDSIQGPTKCDYDLQGLKGNNQFYHVHVRPVPAFKPESTLNNATALAELCGDPSTGGHLNPHHVTAKLPPKSAPLDKYEIGDLSGKHGPLNPVADDRYAGSFVDPLLPLSGESSIIGRSIVIHKNDGKRWVCANIVESKAY